MYFGESGYTPGKKLGTRALKFPKFLTLPVGMLLDPMGENQTWQSPFQGKI